MKFLRSMSTATGGKLYKQIEQKLLALEPTVLEIYDDSSKHRHHQAMIGNTLPETHFRVTIVSEQFQGLSLIKRHRMINDLLKQEFSEGLHALQLNTKTTQEFNKS